MNPVTTNKKQFKTYLKEEGIAYNTINSYSSGMNKITEAIRNLCIVDLGSIYAVVDARLLTHWLNILKEKAEFNVINEDSSRSPHAALKKYIDYIKKLSKQPKQ